jgi:hypothetical protein
MMTIKNPHRLFLIDSFGALLSLVLGLLLAQYAQFFGIPAGLLYKLCLVAGGFMAMGTFCYWSRIKNWQKAMRLLAAANLLYCIFTAGLMVYISPQLKIPGFIYMALEILVISTLALIEWKTAGRAM